MVYIIDDISLVDILSLHSYLISKQRLLTDTELWMKPILNFGSWYSLVCCNSRILSLKVVNFWVRTEKTTWSNHSKIRNWNITCHTILPSFWNIKLHSLCGYAWHSSTPLPTFLYWLHEIVFCGLFWLTLLTYQKLLTLNAYVESSGLVSVLVSINAAMQWA